MQIRKVRRENSVSIQIWVVVVGVVSFRFFFSGGDSKYIQFLRVNKPHLDLRV